MKYNDVYCMYNQNLYLAQCLHLNVGRRIPSPSESPDALPKDFGGMLTSVRAELTSHQYKVHVCKFQMYMYMLHIASKICGVLYSVAAVSVCICILCGVSHACTFSECAMHLHVHACTLTMDSIVQKAARCSQPVESILFNVTHSYVLEPDHFVSLGNQLYCTCYSDSCCYVSVYTLYSTCTYILHLESVHVLYMYMYV